MRGALAHLLLSSKSIAGAWALVWLRRSSFIQQKREQQSFVEVLHAEHYN